MFFSDYVCSIHTQVPLPSSKRTTLPTALLLFYNSFISQVKNYERQKNTLKTRPFLKVIRLKVKTLRAKTIVWKEKQCFLKLFIGHRTNFKRFDKTFKGQDKQFRLKVFWFILFVSNFPRFPPDFLQVNLKLTPRYKSETTARETP